MNRSLGDARSRVRQSVVAYVEGGFLAGLKSLILVESPAVLSGDTADASNVTLRNFKFHSRAG
jgi:hypothetical protein